MRDAYSEEAISAVKDVINAIRTGDGVGWKTLEHQLNISRGRLQAFMNEKTDDLPRIVGMRRILDGLADYLQTNSETSKVPTLVPDAINTVMGRHPHPMEFIKSKLRTDESDQELLATQMAGYYLAIRPSRRGGHILAHTHVINTYRWQGITSVHFRRMVPQGRELSVKGAIYRKDRRVNIVCVENANSCFRMMAMTQYGDSFSKLSGMMSGYEIDGTSFACGIVFTKLNSDNSSYSKVREKTGLIEDSGQVVEVLEAICARPEDVIPEVGGRTLDYISDDIGE